jgi:hypothetical protein
MVLMLSPNFPLSSRSVDQVWVRWVVMFVVQLFLKTMDESVVQECCFRWYSPYVPLTRTVRQRVSTDALRSEEVDLEDDFYRPNNFGA